MTSRAGGALPLTRQFAVDNAFGADGFGFASFGALRATTGVPVAGDRYAMLAWEHSFRTIPFEAMTRSPDGPAT